jgi:alanine racemase
MLSRRSFVATAAAAGLSTGHARSASSTSRPRTQDVADRFDPWIEIDVSALRYNVEVIARLTHTRPILAVVKNNAYGLGLDTVAPILAEWPEIAGFAVVKADAAFALREAGITKPVLLMGMFPPSAGPDLIARRISISLYTDDAGARLDALQATNPVHAHVYLDTGMSRMGMPYHRAEPLLETLGERHDVVLDGTYMAFTEETDFDPEQLRRFRAVTDAARRDGVELGALHAASSNGVYHLPDAHLDMVRPGIALYGAYPSRPDEERAKAELKPAFRLLARVVRVERLRPGDSVSYGRRYTAQRPIWIATIPAGHADGYPRGAVNGARVLINGRSYPVIGAVSASHSIVEVGDEREVSVGDEATLVGYGHPSLHPNEVARVTGASVYDILMHLNPSLPKALRTS